MNNKDMRTWIDDTIHQYTQGRFSVSDTIAIVEKYIYRNTWHIYDIDKRIKTQNRLYKYFFSNMHKAINYMERVSK